jgi:hypothetical protein
MDIKPTGNYEINVRRTPSLSGNIEGKVQPTQTITVYEEKTRADNYDWLQIASGDFTDLWVAWGKVGSKPLWVDVSPEPMPPPPEPDPIPDPPPPIPDGFVVLVNEWTQLESGQFVWESVKLVKVVGHDIIFDLLFIEDDNEIAILGIAKGGKLNEIKLSAWVIE